ncbi:putative exocyst subunit [Clavispora lusitaniae]|uniref:Exocyst complex component SEC5 n=1 Tax=Clavispora lusitaniae TaxID=36911 RepID=A0AA91Q2R7_CLALS|nr:putative exocyst subunit [Clavispora lusitaniae]
MLSYEDDPQTLARFYKPPRSALLDPDVCGPRADPAALAQLPRSDQLERLAHYLENTSASDYRFTDEDFRDPLTGADLVRTLVAKGAVSSAQDPQMNQFLVSSQSFRPSAFLSTAHHDTPIDQLMASLDMLDKSIRGQTSQLKSVLDENFEHFVSCKKTIDEILVAFRNSKSQAQQDREKSKVFNPRSRSSLSDGSGLLSELEKSINNLNLSSTLMIRPIMDHRSKEAKVSKLIEFVQSHRFLFDLPKSLIQRLASHDHEAFIDDYNKYIKEKEQIEESQRQALASADPKDARSIHQDIELQKTTLARVFREIESIAEEYRKSAFEELLSLDHEVSSRNTSDSDVKFINLVEKLHRMEKKSSSDPIYEFLNAQLRKLETTFVQQSEKFEARFILMQKKLTDYVTSLAEYREDGSYVRYIGMKFDTVEEYFKASSSLESSRLSPENQRIIIESFESSENLDLSIINETWLVISNYIKYVEKFFETAVLKFVKNYTHYANPTNGYNVDPDFKIRRAFFSFIDSFVFRLTKIFDVNVPVDQMKVTPSNYESFLPCHANSLSTIFYLSDVSMRISAILTNVGTFTAQIGNATNSLDTNKHIKMFRDASSLIDQKIMEAICATWVNDCSQFYELENWEKYDWSSDKKAQNNNVHTKMMQIIQYYQMFVLHELANLVFRRAFTKEDEVRVVSSYPSKRVLVSLEIQFMRSLNVLMESIMKRFTLEKSITREVLEGDIKQSIYKILTMNNFTVLGDSIAPFLIRLFDQSFDKSLSTQNLKLYADLDKVKITILDDINENEKAWIESRLDEHFDKVEIIQSKDVKIDSFVYDSLIHFVKLVHIVKPITDHAAFVTIVQQLQTQFLLKFLSCLRVVSEKEKVVVRILGNLKLDLDFFVEVFEAGETLKLDDYCLNLVQIIVRQIEKVEGIFKDLGYTQEELNEKLTKALDDSSNEFSCFR